MNAKIDTNIDQRLSMILGVIFLFSMIVLGTWILMMVIPSLSTEFTVGIITAALTIISIFVSKNVEQNTLIANELRQKKTPVYEEYIKFLFKILESQKAGKKTLSEQELTEFMLKFIQQLLVWGADDVIIAFLKFKQASNSHSDGPHAVLFATEDLLLAIRRDLGHKNKGLSKGTLLGIFITDMDELEKQRTIIQ
jgi:hypothetical protein